MSFTSSGRNKGLENEKITRDGDPQGRFNNLRNRSGEVDGERFRESRNANPLRRRGESGDQDSDGWSTVKPRKSFGAEGAERFHGRMGGNFRDDKRPSRDDRLGRSFDTFGRDGDEEARSRNNGLNKGKPDPWHKNEASEPRVPEKRERIDRAKSWREREPEADAPEDHGAGRSHDNKRWGREQRVEREPEWFDEPVEPKVEGRTQQDFQKWMEEMKKSKSGQPAGTQPAAVPSSESPPQSAKPPVRSPPAAETGPDKFFMAFGSTTGMDVTSPSEQADTGRPKPTVKSSRFTSFFQSQDGGKHEQPLPMAATGPPPQPPPANGLAALLGAASGGAQAPDEERQAFQQLLAKLQKQSVSATPPGLSPFAAPPPNNAPEGGRQHAGLSPFQYQQRDDRQDGPMPRPPPQHAQEILAPRPQQQTARPEQLLQDLVGQHQRVSSQGSGRGDGHPSRNNPNTEFLMNLMRAGPDSQRSDSAMMRAAHQAQKQVLPMPHPNEREAEFAQDSRNAQRHMRPPPPPGFPMDDAFRGSEADIGQTRPTQILQRPPPPGLDQMPPGWMGGGQMPPPHPQQQQPQHQPQQPQHQRGPMIPPPGLAGGPGRNGPNVPNGPMPHMFPPNMPPMPPPEAMGNMPPRNMGPPPPGFFNGPPHGFIPPGMGGFNGPPGPESPFVGSPFETRGMPPSAGGRGANFGRG